MDAEAEYSGRTVEDAIKAAESAFGTPRDDLEVEVLSSGSRGVFGLGAEPARVRIRRPVPVPAERVAEMPIEAPPEAPARPAPLDEDEEDEAEVIARENELQGYEAAPDADERTEDLAAEAQEVLGQLLHTMGFDAEISVRSERDPLMLAISGHNLGVLIGRRGDNLAALQFMVNLILSKGRRQWPRVVIDVENYRERREQALQTLADRIAYRVTRNGRPFTLEAMPAGDRRVIHLALRDRPDIETYSIGEGAARRVVVAPKRPEPAR